MHHENCRISIDKPDFLCYNSFGISQEIPGGHHNGGGLLSSFLKRVVFDLSSSTLEGGDRYDIYGSDFASYVADCVCRSDPLFLRLVSPQ